MGTVTVREPGDTPKSPDCATDTVTVSGEDGAGSAVTVNVASPPSAIPPPAATLTTGTAAGGGSSSHWAMATSVRTVRSQRSLSNCALTACASATVIASSPVSTPNAASTRSQRC